MLGQRPLALSGRNRRTRRHHRRIDRRKQDDGDREHDDIDDRQRREVQVDALDPARPRQQDAGDLPDQIAADGTDDAVHERLRQEEHADVHRVQSHGVVDGDLRFPFEDGAEHRI